MNRKFALGCCCLLVIVFGTIVLGIFSARHVFQKGKNWITTHLDAAARSAAIESAWKPPSDRPDASWFPAAVDNWTLSISEDITTVPDLQIDRPGRRGKYRGEKQDIEVTVIPVSDLERDGVFSRADSAFTESNKRVILQKSGNPSYKIESSGSHVSTQTPRRLYVGINGINHLRLWWIKDWLFIFRTTGPEDPDAFAEKFLESITPPELEKR